MKSARTLLALSIAIVTMAVTGCAQRSPYFASARDWGVEGAAVGMIGDNAVVGAAGHYRERDVYVGGPYGYTGAYSGYGAVFGAYPDLRGQLPPYGRFFVWGPPVPYNAIPCEPLPNNFGRSYRALRDAWDVIVPNFYARDIEVRVHGRPHLTVRVPAKSARVLQAVPVNTKLHLQWYFVGNSSPFDGGQTIDILSNGSNATWDGTYIIAPGLLAEGPY